MCYIDGQKNKYSVSFCNKLFKIELSRLLKQDAKFITAVVMQIPVSSNTGPDKKTLRFITLCEIENVILQWKHVFFKALKFWGPASVKWTDDMRLGTSNSSVWVQASKCPTGRNFNIERNIS
jgi:hypothetical protein